MEVSRVCLIRHRLFGQFAEFVTFSSVPAESLTLCRWYHCSPNSPSSNLIHQFAQFVSSF